MSNLDWLMVGLGTVQSLATLGALYFAWRTVKQAAESEREQREERASRRLGDIVDLTADLYHSLLGGGNLRLGPLQAQLGALLSAVDDPLPQCLAFARAPMATMEDRIAAQHIGSSALDELTAAARGD